MGQGWIECISSKQKYRCSRQLSDYLESRDDDSFHGNMIYTGVYITLLKKTLLHLAKQTHKCTQCDSPSIKWSLLKSEEKDFQPLIPVCSCQWTLKTDDPSNASFNTAVDLESPCDDDLSDNVNDWMDNVDGPDSWACSDELENVTMTEIPSRELNLLVENTEMRRKKRGASEKYKDDSCLENVPKVKIELVDMNETFPGLKKRGRGRPKGSKSRKKGREQSKEKTELNDLVKAVIHQQQDSDQSTINKEDITFMEPTEEEQVLLENLKRKTEEAKRKSSHKGVCLKKWNDEDMKQAIELINDGLSIGKAAKQFCIPKATLQRHYHNSTITEARVYICTYCQKTFKSERSVKCHELSHTGEYPFLCDFCGKGFAVETQCKSHVRRVHSQVKKKYACKKCEVEFDQYYLLWRHFRTHTDLPFICRRCGDGFNTLEEITQHRTTQHYSNYKHHCDICGSRYKDRHQLQNHIRQIHTKERPFICPVCSKGFSLHKIMRSHVHNQHGKNMMLEPCPICLKMYKKSTLERHVSVVHAESKRFKCPHCPKEFVVKYNLDRHLLIHSGEKPYLCIYCNSTFQQSGQLKIHHNRHHPELPYQIRMAKDVQNNSDSFSQQNISEMCT